MEDDKAALRRTAALLRSLAALAELAAGRGLAVRILVLWALRWAEAIARDVVVGATRDVPVPVAAATANDTPTEAMRLAASLRYLAWRLEAQVNIAFREGLASRNAPITSHEAILRFQGVRSPMNPDARLFLCRAGDRHPP